MIGTLFTKSELDFIHEQSLTEEDFYDGRGEKKQEWKINAKKMIACL